ncbi:transcription initiation factor TFIID subunit 4-like [Lathamus discolor]|uniref:transcription initiation factor TFIID subunit 4-like n=1 Tax=Lathamus discolor TaxID=678569 RepID=UPI0032B74028
MWQLSFWHRSCSTHSHAPGDALTSGWVHPTSRPFPLGAAAPCREHCVLWGSSLSPPLSEAGQGQTQNLGHPRALAWGGSCAPQVVPSPMSLLSSSPPGAGAFSPLQPRAGAGRCSHCPKGLTLLSQGRWSPPALALWVWVSVTPLGVPAPALPRALLVAERPHPAPGQREPCLGHGAGTPVCFPLGVGVRGLTRRGVTLNKEHLNREPAPCLLRSVPGGAAVPRRRTRRALFAISTGAGPRASPAPSKGPAGAARSQSRGSRAPRQERGSRAPAPGSLPLPGSAMAGLAPLLLLAALGSARLERRPAPWDAGADAERTPARGCANLTVVLDNWKFAITSQLRNLLLFDHHTVLPDYGRIRSLSGALDGLYRDFTALKEQLGRLSARFAELEAVVEQLSRARGTGTPPRRRGPARAPP